MARVFGRGRRAPATTLSEDLSDTARQTRLLTGKMSLRDRINSHFFGLVHGKNLVYNACWEDPRLDREALEIGPRDRVLVITSAGCNALDYALQAPEHVHAVDMNPIQNALLELKLTAIRQLDFDTFFSMFGRGRLTGHWDIYQTRLRPFLSHVAQRYWDKNINFFAGIGWCKSFYFHGSSGKFARLVNTYIDRVAKVRDGIDRLLNAESLEQQRELYQQLRSVFWKRSVRWAVGQDATLSMLGVPRPQRQQVERDYRGGIVQFIEDSIEAVFANLPLKDNYFWRVYLTGEYTRDCCPEYLKRENFERLKGGLADRVTTHTSSILDFLKHYNGTISRYVLLDHMDWLSTFRQPILEREWQGLVDRAAPETRFIWRSGGLRTDFVERVQVECDGQRRAVGDLLQFDRERAARLHERDRVHTYGSFYIARLNKS